MQSRDHNTPCMPSMARVASRAEWDAFAQRLRAHVRLACGLLPELPPAPLRALRAHAYTGDGFRIERFALETLPGYYLTGSLFLPERPVGRRAPAMLQPHGHFAQGRLNTPDVRRAIALAQAGAWVLMYDMVGYNDHLQMPHGGDEPDEWHRWGFSRAGLQTWNSLCAFEWLARQPEVDAKRIGCSGISGGGTQTFLLAAVEPRLCCAAPVKMVSTRMQGGCICENPPLLRLFACNPEIAALCAPRPMLLISDSEDWTADNPEHVAPFIRRVYQLYGASERFQHVHLREGHQFGAEARAAYYRWAAQVLKLNFVPDDPSVDALELLHALRVWGDALPRPFVPGDGAFVFARYRAAVQASLSRWQRRRAFRRELRDALLSMLGLPELPEAPESQGKPVAKRQWMVVIREGGTPPEGLPAGAHAQVWHVPSPAAPKSAFFDTYNLTPLAGLARELLVRVQALRAQGMQVHLIADSAGAAVAAIVAALTGVRCRLPESPEEPSNLPCWARIGGFATLRRLIRV